MKTNIQKEPEESRKERIRMSKTMATKTSDNPKAYNKNKERKNFQFFEVE